MCCEVGSPTLFFCMWISSCFSTIWWKDYFPQLNCPSTFFKSQLTVNMRVISGLSIYSYFTLFLRIVFLILLLLHSLILYTNTINFWILILYHATSLNSCISSNVLLEYSFEFSLYNIRDSFTSSFLIWMSFISFSCLIAPAIPSSTRWIEMARVYILVLFLILGGNPSVFHH